MAFTVLAFLTFVFARAHVAGPGVGIGWKAACAATLAVIVRCVPRVTSTAIFGALGVAYVCVLQMGVMVNVVGVEQPLVWLLPAGMIIPIGAAPLWLTPKHFIIGTTAYYLTAIQFVFSLPVTHDDWILCTMWMGIGIPAAIVFHFAFYWFRQNHYLLEDELRLLAATDPLTSLLNRRAFLDQALELLSRSARNTRQISAVFLDIDRFKSLNDQYGHAKGDDALVAVAQALRKVVPKHALIGRLGGEEFAVLLEGAAAYRVMELAEAIRQSVARIERPDGALTASFGVAHRRPNESIVELLERADEALLRAKHAGRNRVFEERLDKVERVRTTALSAMVPQVSNNEEVSAHWRNITLYSNFQPIFSLAHQKPVGYEALLRGRTFGGAPLSPAVIFAETPSEEMVPLDHVTHRLHISSAHGRLQDATWLFLNVTPMSFIESGYEFTLAKLVAEMGLRPSNVVLEILESEAVDVEDLALAAWRYRACGFLIAIDDFGAGYSNLDRLLRIQPDLVKLDGELIRAKSRASDQPLLPAIVGMLHEAAMRVVVEGIETTEELILAIESNVDFAQGFLLGRPGLAIGCAETAQPRIDHAFDVIAEGRIKRQQRFESQIHGYLQSVSSIVDGLKNGMTFRDASADIASLELCTHCFFFDGNGRILDSMVAPIKANSQRYGGAPAPDPRLARWDHQAYYWKAVSSVGSPVFTRPYLSSTTGRTCLGVSMAFQLNTLMRVVGLELDWNSPHLTWPTIA